MSKPLNSSVKFLQGVIFDRDKIRQEIPGVDIEFCVNIILHKIPREAYSYPAAVDINGELTLILVFNAGDDEEYL